MSQSSSRSPLFLALAAATLAVATAPGVAAQSTTQSDTDADTMSVPATAGNAPSTAGADRANAPQPHTGTSPHPASKGQSDGTPHAHAGGKPHAGHGVQAELNDKDRKFLEAAIASNRAEVELGRIAQARGQSNEVKEFGQRMQKDHADANRDLLALGGMASIDEVELERKQQRKLDKLGEIEDGAEFDAEYAETMVSMHRKDVALFEKVAEQDGYSAPVRELARAKLDVLRHHLQMAEQLEQTVDRLAATDDE